MSEDGQESSLSDFDAARSSLRQRWELASVLNFFKVFEPVIETNLKISAEEIETALILPNRSLAQIHISLLKGIPPINKNLKDPDGWVVSLSKKLAMWWPWVAEGAFPLTTTKGEEMSTYKKLDPTIRLVVLKALCEIRADQHDVVSYINDGVKNKNEMSTFRKNNIGEDGKGISYWCDGDEVIGFRLYKEVNTFYKNEPQISWETLATNLEEFQKVVDEYSSSTLKLEVDVSGVVENEVMPALNRIQKKRERALQKKRKEERILNNFCRVGITRSCRNRNSKPISYTFDEYDKAINEAIRETKKMKTKEEPRIRKKETVIVNKDSDEEEDDDNHHPTDDELTESDSENSKHESENNSENNNNQESSEESNKNDNDNDENNDFVDDSEESSEDELVQKSEIENGKTRETKKVNGKRDSDSDGSNEEMRNFGAKKRLRQRPNRNTAIENAIVSDTEDESANSDS